MRMRKEKMVCHRGRMKIVGSIYIPDGDGPFPLLIYSHGFGWNYEEINLEHFADEGIAACRFDFCGGSGFSRSSGSMLNMSAMTEAEDLQAVLDYCLQDERFDKEKIFLTGNSQGGYVSTVVGIQRQQDVKELFLLCPAYVISDFKNTYFQGKLPKHPFRFGGMLVGARYVMDVEQYPIYEHMRELNLPVTIYHGTADNMAPISYSEKAMEYLPNANFMKISGAGHMLSSHAAIIEKDMIEKIKAS